MRDRTERGIEKERVTLYLPVLLYTRVRHRAIDLGKTISKYVSDLMERDMGEGE